MHAQPKALFDKLCRVRQWMCLPCFSRPFPTLAEREGDPRYFPMRRAFLRTRMLIPTASAVAALSVVLAGQDQPKQPAFRSGASTVAVYTTVTDSTGRLVPDLTKEDFEIYDNGKLQPITLFATETQPLSVVVMLDRSGSMKESFSLVALGAEEFVKRLLPADKARIGSFATKIQVDPEEFTSDRKTLIDILRSEMQPDGPTPLWNAANVAIRELLPQDGRKVVLLFTDGVDSPMNFKTNNLSVMDVMERATKEDVMLYAIGLESRMPYGRRQAPLGGGGLSGGFGGQSGGGMTQRPDPGLPKIAAETGGGYFELTRADDLKATFARVADELHQQYALAFEPTKLDGKTHDLEVKLKTRGMKARARKSYLAAKPRTS
jgi:Ca-activated chloride channel family protein